MHIRSDISYSVRVMIKYCVNSSELHCQLIEKIFRYLADTISLRLTFKKSSISDDLIEYSDSNFASHMNDRKFISEYAFLLAEIAISHSFKLQNTVALSITEVEYMCQTSMMAEPGRVSTPSPASACAARTRSYRPHFSVFSVLFSKCS
jgi:hypothetical protein